MNDYTRNLNQARSKISNLHRSGFLVCKIISMRTDAKREIRGFDRTHQNTFYSVHILASLVLLLLLSLPLGSAGRTVRVGAYDNPPKMTLTPDGEPGGLFTDIIRDIASREGWDLDFIPGTWEDLLIRLEKGEIDLMPDVAFSPERKKRFDFNEITVFSSWLQFYAPAGFSLRSLQDLQGKTVAVLKGSIQHQICFDLRKNFGLSFSVTALPDYETVIREVTSGQADCMLASGYYGYKNGLNKTLSPAPVILQPTTLHFATARKKNPELLSAIDANLVEMINDIHSVYYKSVISWLGEKPQMFIPRYMIRTLIGLCAALLLMLLLSLLLLIRLNRKTGELRRTQKDAVHRERLYTAGQMACGLAHDLNNILVPIIAYAEEMLSDSRNPDNRVSATAKLREISVAAWNGAEMVRRMQEFYRRTGKTEPKTGIDLNAAIREVVQLAKHHDKFKALTGWPAVSFDLRLGAIPPLSGRKSEIHEIVMNLVLNAADALSRGGLITITTESVDRKIRLSVCDNGSGMTATEKEKCFQPFFSTKGENGTGMGLSIVNNIVSEYNGSIEIISAPGAGTTFIIILPRD